MKSRVSDRPPTGPAEEYFRVSESAHAHKHMPRIVSVVCPSISLTDVHGHQTSQLAASQGNKTLIVLKRIEWTHPNKREKDELNI